MKGLKNIVAINCNGAIIFAMNANGQTYTDFHLDGNSTDFWYKKADRSGEYKTLSVGRGNMTLGIKQDGSVWYNNVEIPEFRGARDVAAFGGMSGENRIYCFK